MAVRFQSDLKWIKIEADDRSMYGGLKMLLHQFPFLSSFLFHPS